MMTKLKWNDVILGFIPGIILASITASFFYWILSLFGIDLIGGGDLIILISRGTPGYLLGIILGLIVGIIDGKRDGNIKKTVFISTLIVGAIVPVLLSILWIMFI